MQKNRNNKRSKIQHVFVLLLLLVAIASIMTYIIPPGEFIRVKSPDTGADVVLSGSYRFAEGGPVPLWEIPVKIFEALTSKSTSQLIFFIFLIGGSFEIVMETGSMESLFKAALSRVKGHDFLVIPMFVTLFSVLGFTMGLTTASVMFVPIGIMAARSMGLGTLTGTAMVALGVNAGFAAGIYNPFSVGIAQTIAQVPLYSGAWMRWLLLVCLLIPTSIYIRRYGEKYDVCIACKSEGLKAETASIDQTQEQAAGVHSGFLLREKLVIWIFAVSFAVVTYGIQAFGWKIGEIAALFLVTSVLCGVVYGLETNAICETFVKGCKKMVKGAIVIGLAGTMRLVLSEGNILDTIALYLVSMADDFPQWGKLLGMFYGNAALNFLITSGSTKAAIAMPIMVPMADCMGLTRQSAVFAFQLGDGLLNLCSPLSTTLTGIMAVSGITYDKWVRFFFPLVGIYVIIGTALMLLAGAVGY